MSIIHNHGAARSGTKSERMLQQITTELGFDYLKVQADYERHNIDQWGTRYHKPPDGWPQLTPKGSQRKYEADGYILLPNGSGIIIEQKHSDKHGTTEEKVFYDLEKIRLGVYGDTPLWYVFTGNVAELTNAYKEFEVRLKASNVKNVKVIWGTNNFKKELAKFQ